MNSKNKPLLFGASAFIVTVVLGAAVMSVSGGGEQSGVSGQQSLGAQSLRQFTTSDQSLTFSYSDVLSEQTLTEQDIQDGFIGRLSSSDPAVLVSIRKEENLQSIASATNTDIYTLLKDNVSRSLPERYTGYQLIEQSETTVSGKSAFETVFRYTGGSDSTIQQRLVTIVGDNTATYIAMQTTQNQYEEQNKKTFKPLTNSTNIK